MSSSNHDPSNREYSFPSPYKFSPKPGQPAVEITAKELRRRKVFERFWKRICRQALTAGLTTTEAEQIAKWVLFATTHYWRKRPEELTIWNFKSWVLSCARRHIAETVRRKHNPTPYDVSIAWRQKHDAA